ncbi:hypothetical protein ACFPRL_08125 [Pseudoclavibacter helvolus]
MPTDRRGRRGRGVRRGELTEPAQERDSEQHREGASSSGDGRCKWRRVAHAVIVLRREVVFRVR